MICARTSQNLVVNGGTMASGLRGVFVMSTVVKEVFTNRDRRMSSIYVQMIQILEEKVHNLSFRKLKIRLKVRKLKYFTKVQKW
jgi:hypothetical protein